MSGSSARLRASEAVTNYRPTTPPLNFAETPAGELFGSNVFSARLMKERLPKEIYKSVQKTMEEGAKPKSTTAFWPRTAQAPP